MLRLTNIRLLLALAAAFALVAAAACGGAEEEETTTGETAAVAPTVVSGVPAGAPATPTTAATESMAKDTKETMKDESAMMATEFKGTFLWDGPQPTSFGEAPILAAMVQSGDLPAVEERLPEASDIMVIPVVERIGDYGGTWRRAFTGPNDGQNADRLMMDPNIYYDLDGTTLIPNIVKEWETSDDGLTYTWHLRKGMKWSDGAPFTADDYVWYNENVIRNEDISPGRDAKLGYTNYAPEIKKVDDHTVQFIFTDQTAGFLDDTATYLIGAWTLHGRGASATFGPSHWLKQHHRDFVDDKDAFDKTVADEGFEGWGVYFKNKSDNLRSVGLPTIAPWVVTSPNTGEIWEFERNPYYWATDPAGNQLPYIDKISMRLAGDKEVLNLRAIAGELDFQHRHIDMAKVPVFQENAAENNYQIRFWSQDGTQAAFAINQSYGLGGIDEEADPEVQKWLTNLDFRKALSLALDRKKINEVVFLGVGKLKQPTYNVTHPFYPGEDIESYYTEYDPDRANEILDSIGLDKKDGSGFRLRTDGSGEPLQIELVYIAEYFLDYQSMAEIAKEDWEKIGVKMNIKAEDVKLFSDRRKGNLHQINADGCCDRHPLSVKAGRSAFPAFGNWFNNGKSCTPDGKTERLGEACAEPTDPEILKLVELSDVIENLKYQERTQNYIDTQKISVQNLYYISAVGDTPAFNGVIVMKNYFKNVPQLAPNISQLQNPGIGRTAQYFLEGGKNDSE